MKPCRIVFEGKPYLINQYGVVAELAGGDFMSGFNIISFVGSETSERVKAEAKRIKCAGLIGCRGKK